MTRLFINLFFIVIVCITLSVMPVNTDVLGMFNFDDIFEEDLPIEEEVPVDETFVAEYTAKFNIENDAINPTEASVELITNIPKEYEGSYTFDDLAMTLSQNDEVYAHIPYNKLVSNQSIEYPDNQIKIIYTINLDFYHLDLSRDGFFTADLYFEDVEKSELRKSSAIAYRPQIDYVENGSAENNGNFIYKAFALNQDESSLVPLYFSVDYPESITVEARNRLYDTPPANSGLSTSPVLPDKTSVSKIGDKHYGIFFYTDEINKLITTPERAELAVDAVIRTLIRLPHIGKISIFVDEAQVEGSFYNIDLSKVYTAPLQSYAYLTEPTSNMKRYLIPVPVSEDNIYDEVWSIFALLKSGNTEEKQWTQIIPPNVNINNFIIEGTTITVDFNENLLTAYKDEEYQKLMINSILYSLTSIENINRVKITIDGNPLTSFAGYDFTEAVLAPPYINYIGEY